MVGGNEWEIVFLFSGAIFPVRFSFTGATCPSAPSSGHPESNF